MLVAFLALTILFTPMLVSASFDKNLSYGQRNNTDVKELQRFLKEFKLYSGPVTGNYLSLTRTAVVKFQKQQGVKQTGQFDSATRDKADTIVFNNEASSFWRDTEKEMFAEANNRGLLDFVATDSSGAKKYYKKINNQWIRDKANGGIQQQPSVQAPPTVVCNGKRWTQCPSGKKFYCPSTGDAQCLIETITNPINPMTNKPCIDPTCSIDLDLELLKSQLSRPSIPPSYTYPKTYTPPAPTSDPWAELQQDNLYRSLCEKAGGSYSSIMKSCW